MSAVRGPYRGKRVVDLVVTLAVAPFALALGAVCAVLVRVNSRGPIFFTQPRVGLDGQIFTVLKFRTMLHDGADNPVHPDRDRITGVGRVLRRASLDELPQLINVVRGEMSVVGPRPTLQYQVERYDEHQRGRLAVRPGLTGLAQVRSRNAATWAERIELDLEYVERQSVKLDSSLILRTFGALLKGSGVEGHPIDDPIARPEGM